MTYRQESEKDEEHALICLSAPKQMKHSQEPETDEEREKTLLTLAQRTFRTWRVAKGFWQSYSPFQTLDMYSPVRVSIRIVSPSLTNIGTWSS